MKAITLFKPCLLACSVLAGAHAVAGTITINSIEFSFMSYSSTPPPVFSGSSGSSLGNLPTVMPTPTEDMSSVVVPMPAQITPIIEVYVPSGPGGTGSTAPVIEVSQPSTDPAAAAVIPEPGTVALLGLGLGMLVMRRRGGSHA